MPQDSKISEYLSENSQIEALNGPMIANDEKKDQLESLRAPKVSDHFTPAFKELLRSQSRRAPVTSQPTAASSSPRLKGIRSTISNPRSHLTKLINLPFFS